MAAAGVDAFFFLSEQTFIRPPLVFQRIVELINARGWPSTSHERLWTRAGGLASLSSDLRGMARGAALYIHRILQGARPSELPVIHPTRFELVINLKTAKSLGLTIPLPLLGRADEVIEQATVLAQAAWGRQLAPSRSMALSVVIILRMTATRMTLGFLPAAARRLWNVLRAGL